MNGSRTSDERYKENIVDATAGLSFINDLRPVNFEWKKEKDVPPDLEAYEEGSEKRVMGIEGTQHGFISQEVKAVIDNHSEIKSGFGMWYEYTNGIQTLADSALIPILVKAVQDLSAKVNRLENQVVNLTLYPGYPEWVGGCATDTATLN